MLTIWKYAIPPEKEFELTMPEDFVPLRIELQGGLPMMWALVDSDHELRATHFRTYFTGETVDAFGDTVDAHNTYIGTFAVNGIVWHLFCLEGVAW